MILRKYANVFYSNSGPHRSFAKKAYSMNVEDLVKEWEQNKDDLDSQRVDNESIISSVFNYIDDELLEKTEYPETVDIFFTKDGNYRLVRNKYVPQGKVRERFEVQIMELQAERELSEKEEAFVNKLKEFRARDGASKLSRCAEDFSALRAAKEWCHWSYEAPDIDKECPDFGTIDIGPLKDYMDVEIVNYDPLTNWPRGFFTQAVRSALYQCDTVDEAIDLANSVFETCGCGRRLTDEELVALGVDLNSYHKRWPRIYIGEKMGYLFVSVNSDSDSSGVSRDLGHFRVLLIDAEDRAYASALYRGSGGLYRCGGTPV